MTEQSLAELAGHDLSAMSRLESLGESYRRGGITGLRAAVILYLDEEAEGPLNWDLAALIVEAVLTIAERTGTTAAHSRRAWQHLDAEDARTEATRTEQGGNR